MDGAATCALHACRCCTCAPACPPSNNYRSRTSSLRTSHCRVRQHDHCMFVMLVGVCSSVAMGARKNAHNSTVCALNAMPCRARRCCSARRRLLHHPALAHGGVLRRVHGGGGGAAVQLVLLLQHHLQRQLPGRCGAPCSTPTAEAPSCAGRGAQRHKQPTGTKGPSCCSPDRHCHPRLSSQRHQLNQAVTGDWVDAPRPLQ